MNQVILKEINYYLKALTLGIAGKDKFIEN